MNCCWCCVVRIASSLSTKYYTKTNVPPPMWVLLLTLLHSWTLGTGYWLVTCPPLFQDEGVRGGEREERPPDPRARQEEQPLGGEGEVRHHVDRLTSDFCTRDLVCFLFARCWVFVVHVTAPGKGPRLRTLSSQLTWSRGRFCDQDQVFGGLSTAGWNTPGYHQKNFFACFIVKQSLKISANFKESLKTARRSYVV